MMTISFYETIFTLDHLEYFLKLGLCMMLLLHPIHYPFIKWETSVLSQRFLQENIPEYYSGFCFFTTSEFDKFLQKFCASNWYSS